VRGILAIIVVVVQVAGPWFCCCGPMRDLASVKRTPVVHDSSPAVPACPHCKSKESSTTSGDQNLPDTQDSQPSGSAPTQCPYAGECWDSRFIAPLNLEDHDVSGYLITADSVDAFTPLVLVLNHAIDRVRTPNLPFLSTEARLFEHHALRC